MHRGLMCLGCAGFLKHGNFCSVQQHVSVWSMERCDCFSMKLPGCPIQDTKALSGHSGDLKKSQFQSQPTSLLPGIRFNAQYCQLSVGTCQKPLSSTKQQQHLPSASEEIETCAAAAAEHLLGNSGWRVRHSVHQGKPVEQVFR